MTDTTTHLLQQHGYPRPVLLNRAGTVLVGGPLLDVADATGVEPRIEVVESAADAALLSLQTGRLGVLETADLIAALTRELSADSALEHTQVGAPKLSRRVSAWIRKQLGHCSGFSPRQVELYLRIARLPQVDRERLVGVATLNQAKEILWGRHRSARRRQPTSDSPVQLALELLGHPALTSPDLSPAERNCLIMVAKDLINMLETKNP